MVIVTLQLSPNFNVLSRQRPHVASIFQVVGKDDRRKGAEPVVFAKIEVVDSINSSFYPNYLSGYALGFTDVLLGGIKRNAGGRRKLREQRRGGEHRPGTEHIEILVRCAPICGHQDRENY